MSKTSNAVKDRWNAKAYDNITLRVPKGRKRLIEAFAKKQGRSVNSFINDQIYTAMGFTESEWKQEETEENTDA